MSYLASTLIFNFKNYVKNAILGQDFNLSVAGSFFHAFTLMDQAICSKIYNAKN